MIVEPSHAEAVRIADEISRAYIGPGPDSHHSAHSLRLWRRLRSWLSGSFSTRRSGCPA